MSSSFTLYTRLFECIRVFHPNIHVKRISNWVWVVVGLIQSQSVHLSEIAQHIPSDAKAAGRIAQVRRWLANPFVQATQFYEPLIAQVLQAWQGRAVFIILDGTEVNHGTLQFFRVSLSHCFRALPLAWLVRAGRGLIQQEACAELLGHTARLLQEIRSVTFLADRGFRDTDWAEKCLALGWNYLIRVANSTYVTLATGEQLCVRQLACPGRNRYFYNVGLTKEKKFPCNLMLTWLATEKGELELGVLITNLRPCHQTLKQYVKRMHIEQSFRDDKSGGFDLQATKLQDVDRLDHLLLAVAVAVLWIYEIGEHVIRAHQRSEIDPAYKRQLSIFQIGWRKLRRAISCLNIPPFTLQIQPLRLEPVWRKC